MPAEVSRGEPVAVFLKKDLTESIGLADSLATSTTISLTESITNTDSVASEISKQLTVPISLQDQAPVFSIEHIIPEYLGLADIISKSTTTGLSDSTQLADSFESTLVITQELTETATTSDSVMKSPSRNITEPLGLADSYTSDVSISKLEPLLLADLAAFSLSTALGE